MTEEELDNDCTNCPAFNICPEKPVREDYADENEYLIDLECGVWSCQKTIEKLCKENEQLKAQIKKMKCCLNCRWFLLRLECEIYKPYCCENDKYLQTEKVCKKWEVVE